MMCAVNCFNASWQLSVIEDRDPAAEFLQRNFARVVAFGGKKRIAVLKHRKRHGRRRDKAHRS